jgi:hypothetical protein
MFREDVSNSDACRTIDPKRDPKENDLKKLDPKNPR